MVSLVNLVASFAAAVGAIVVLPTWSLDELSGQVASLMEASSLPAHAAAVSSAVKLVFLPEASLLAYAWSYESTG